MRSYVERARAANPLVRDERKLIDIACAAYNNNVNRSINQKPVTATVHVQEIRDFTAAQRAKNYDKKWKKYEAAEEYQVGELVRRRMRKPFSKESGLSNVSQNVYKIIKVEKTWPLPSYKLEDTVQGVVLPGSYQANVLVKK
jgi:hypothetical protein